jgi:hypothetical protein
VTCTKRNTQLRRRYLHPVERIGACVLRNQTCALTGFNASNNCPAA